jgi:hypothetical protein
MILKPKLFRYWLALNASAFDAAVHSCVAFFGVAGAHAAVASIPALNPRQCAAVFLISFLRGVLLFLDAHPLAELPLGRLDEPAAQPSDPAEPVLSAAPANADAAAALVRAPLVPAA